MNDEKIVTFAKEREYKYFKTSSKDGEGVNEAFIEMFR